jgi:trehalose 6-phosphate phosphatase
MHDLPPPLRLPSDAALFLDLDGTLAPIAAVPDAVGPDPRRTKLIRELAARLGGRVAVVSGRSVADVDRILEGAAPTVAGVHGLDLRLAGGVRETAAAHPALAEARARLEAFAERDSGLRVEDKGLGVTLHYRLAPGQEADASALGQAIADDTGLVLQPGDKVVELRTPGRNKGDALEHLMRQPPFAGARPVFVGDDRTDEDGFAAAARLGGFGVLVGRPRSTLARARLPDVEAVLAWLGTALLEKSA